MRSLETILSTRGIRLAKLSNALNERVSAVDVFNLDKYNLKEFIVDEEGTLAFGGDYYDTASGKQLNFMFSVQGGWEHLSVSMPSRTPTWDQMCKMKDIFFDEEEEAFEYHPKRSEYVNVHPHCLHIWRPIYSEIFSNFIDMGLVQRSESVKVKDLMSKLFEDKPDMWDSLLALYEAENGGESLDSQTIQLYDKVPADLLCMPTPPYFRVGTKSEEGFNIIKDIAKKNGARVGLAIQGDEDE